MFGERLDKLIKKNNMSNYDLAKEINMSESLISAYRRGVRKPAYDNILKIANYFKVSTDYLYGRDGIIKTISIPIFNTPVSAGTGAWLTDTEEFEEKEFNVEDIPYNADFALVIRGDSMEPNYSDGDIVFVKKDVFVEQKQIGIFCLNNNGYIKQLSGNYLVSLNKNYPPIEIGEYDTFYPIGRVVGKL